jgi:hypothetical protein
LQGAMPLDDASLGIAVGENAPRCARRPVQSGSAMQRALAGKGGPLIGVRLAPPCLVFDDAGEQELIHVHAATLSHSRGQFGRSFCRRVRRARGRGCVALRRGPGLPTLGTTNDARLTPRERHLIGQAGPGRTRPQVSSRGRPPIWPTNSYPHCRQMPNLSGQWMSQTTGVPHATVVRCVSAGDVAEVDHDAAGGR